MPVKQTKAVKLSRGARLLAQRVKKLGSYEKAADGLRRATGRPYIRASLWHWATGLHRPSREAAIDLHKWSKIAPNAWDRA